MLVPNKLRAKQQSPNDVTYMSIHLYIDLKAGVKDQDNTQVIITCFNLFVFS